MFSELSCCVSDFLPHPHSSSPQNNSVLLGNLSNYFHESMRPRVIRESSFTQLTLLCEVFFAQILQQSKDADAERVAYQAAMTGILEDVQNKLIFRGQEFVRSQVERFVPKPDDLDYPNKLVEPTGEERPEGGLARSLIIASDQDPAGLKQNPLFSFFFLDP